MWHTVSGPIRHQISLSRPTFEEFIDPSKLHFEFENEAGKLRLYDFPDHIDERRLLSEGSAEKALHFLQAERNFPQAYQDFVQGASRTLYLRIDSADRATFLENL